MPTSYPYADIFNRLLEGRVSPDEAETLIEWLARDEQDPEAKALVLTQLRQVIDEEQISGELRNKLAAKLPAILARETSRRPSIVTWMRYSSVAAVLLLVCAGIYILSNRQQAKPPIVAKIPAKRDIAPGKQGAILTLADGSTMVLDSLGDGVVATQNGTKVTLDNGRLAYSANATPTSTTAIAYNTMTTPKGREFQLTLPDGTKVWLDAASSIHYPTAFTGSQREVDVSGEAYFEVAKDNRHPFLVKIDETTRVQVLGTHFNINAYSDEASINTTLLQGSVRVISNGEKAVLKPGQQAQTKQNKILVTNADTEKVMAWKNGIFDFQDASLEEVMRQLQRWYDIDVVYEKKIPKIEFIGKMGRDLSLSEVLGGLQLSKVHFRLEEGRKLVVLP
ncbi:MAG TPA: FecR domain-containing protein [Puia sp.]|nr:FecR domain-containing protein [Puia sp.]